MQCNAVPRCHLVIAPRLYEAPTWPHQPTQQNHTKEQVVRVLGFWNFWRSCVWIIYMCMVFLPGLLKGRLYLNKQQLLIVNTQFSDCFGKFYFEFEPNLVALDLLQGQVSGAQVDFMVLGRGRNTNNQRLLSNYCRNICMYRTPDKSGKCYC